MHCEPAAYFPGEFEEIEPELNYEVESRSWIHAMLTTDCKSLNFATTRVWDSTDAAEAEDGQECVTVTTETRVCEGSFGCSCTGTTVHAETCIPA